MARCLRCGAGAEWLEGDTPLREIAASDLLELPVREARRAFEVWYYSHLLTKYKRISAVADAAGLDRSSIYDKLRSIGVLKK